MLFRSAVNEPTCGFTGTNEECNRYGVTEDITKPYNTSIGYLASTTGNISGIYDMSGGAYEYAMGVMVDESGNLLSGINSLSHSGFNGAFYCPTCDGDTSGLTELTTGLNFPDAKYYDQYLYAKDDIDFQRRILGDATGEMGPFQYFTYGSSRRPNGSWYDDYSWFVASWNPWALRSGSSSDGIQAGIFAFGDTSGSATLWTGFRVVLIV